MRPSFFHHLHPPTIPAAQARWRYTLGAGGLAVFLALALVLTGAFEMFYYVPDPQKAALSIQTITYLAPFGGLIRNLHYWAAQLLLLVSAVHLLRVILTGAYARPRRFNYLLGLLLLGLIVLLDFTGYVLRWDEGVRWVLVAGTNLVRSVPVIGESLYGILMGGDQPGAASLVRFYGWHVFGLTLALVFTGAWHLFRVRRDGGIAVPPPGLRQEPARITRFELVRREALAAILGGVVLLALALLRPAPIGPPMGQDILSISDGRAPWFFVWVQQLLRLGDPFMWGVLVPVGVLTWLAILPYVLPEARAEELGRWFPRGNRLARASVIVLCTAILILTLVGYL